MRTLDVPCADNDLEAKLHTKVPVEGVGVVHVITDLEVAETDVILWRYNGSTPVECVHLSSCGGSPDSAQEMHIYWCDLETIGLLVRGQLYVTYLIDDDYMCRKQYGLFGWPY